MKILAETMDRILADARTLQEQLVQARGDQTRLTVGQERRQRALDRAIRHVAALLDEAECVKSALILP